MLKLPKVTLVAMCSERFKDQCQKALDYSTQGVEFGAVKLIIKESKDVDEWCKSIVYDLGDYIDTEYALLVHPEGFVVHPEVWDDNWLKYDFIGSPFPLPQDDFSYRDIHGTVQRVGNSVSLRSKKLLTLPKKIGMEWKPFHGYYNEDGYISVNMRHVFEEHGCKFAPFEEALKFGRETPLPEYTGHTFVFHKHQGVNAQYPDFEK